MADCKSDVIMIEVRRLLERSTLARTGGLLVGCVKKRGRLVWEVDDGCGRDRMARVWFHMAWLCLSKWCLELVRLSWTG